MPYLDLIFPMDFLTFVYDFLSFLLKVFSFTNQGTFFPITHLTLYHSLIFFLIFT
jgi:hypothetical protein